MKKSGARRILRPHIRKHFLAPIIFIGLYLLLLLATRSASQNPGMVALDFLLCLFGFQFWMFFFAQFALPLNRFSNRIEAIKRLFLYLTGLHGPALRVENGEVRERKGESDKSGPGVIILDTASAGMVASVSEFKGAVGPGVAFTERFEKLAGTVDLHLTRANMGPKEDEDPFVPQTNDESEPEYGARQKRRFLTQGITRDGIFVAPKISVAVRLDCEQKRGNTHYGFDPNAVRAVITGSPVDATAAEEKNSYTINITNLPLQFAADIWRDCLSRYTLEELFAFEPGNPTALQRIIAEMRQRMTRPRYQRTDQFGRPTGNQQISPEYVQLKKRGIRVISVTLTYLKMPRNVEDQLVQFYISNWKIRAIREREYVEQQRSYETELGKQNAVEMFASGSTHFLGNQSPNQRLTGEQILRQLVRGSIYLVNQDGFIHRQATDEIDQLKELLEWSEQNLEAR